MATRPPKRRRVKVLTIGAPSEADSPANQMNAPSSSAFSVRHVQRVVHVQSLTTLCARVFVAYFPRLSKDKRIWQPRKEWEAISEWLKELPDSIIPTLFGMLRSSCPELLSHELVKEHFLRGNTVILSTDLGGQQPVNKFTVAAVVDLGSSLTELRLQGFDKLVDKSFAAIITRLPSLEVLYLGGCTKVGPLTVQAVVKSCPALTAINFNYTSVLPVVLAPLLLARREQLAVLKVAGMSHWTDTAFNKLLAALPSGNDFQLPALGTLKLRQTSLSDSSFNILLPACPNLRRLDLSFTKVRRLHKSTIESLSGLEKLSLTSTSILPDDLVTLVAGAPHLVTLVAGALGGGRGQASAIGNTSSMTMTDHILSELTDALENCHGLRVVNLVGNTKIRASLPGFIRRVGRNLKRLNLAGISSLKSSDLAFLSPNDPAEDICALEELVLNNTSIDDGAASYISSCPSLETLKVAATKLSNDGLFPIIDACPVLTKLNVTRCRGVPVSDRRRLFEVWEEQRNP